MATWASLTQKQRKHLITACAQGLNPKLPTTDLVVLEALQGLELIHETRNSKGRPVWRPTAAGRDLVASRGLIATFLHQRSQYGYTHSSHQAMRAEPEVMY